MLTMLAYAVFFVVISSGSIFCCIRFRRKYEEILPITCMGIVLILFVFGILGILKIGVLAVMLIVAALYLLSGAMLIKKKNWKDFLPDVVTPGSVIFFCTCIAFALLNRGRLAYDWGEFSHWVDIVKVMTTLNDFGTNPASNSLFQSYPPGMSLFEYFLQRIVLFFKPEDVFHEASIYVAYQVFFTSLLFPFFKGQSFRHPLRLLLTCTGIFVTPLIFSFNSVYGDVTVETILGIFAGAGFAMVFLNEDQDWAYSLYIWMLCAMLVLVKDSGMLFAVLLAAAYCFGIFDRTRKSGHIASSQKKWMLAGASVLFVSLPKLLWNLELKTSGATVVFSEKIDFVRLLKVLTGQDDTYFSTVLNNWINAQFSSHINLGYTNISLNYFTLFLIFCLSAYILYKLFAAKEPQFRWTRGWVSFIMVAEIFIYLFGLCVMYMFKFTELKAVSLAEHDRYVSATFLAAWVTVEFIAIRAIDFAPSPDKKQTASLVLLFVFLVASPVQKMYAFVHRDIVRTSISVRARYASMCNKINDVSDGQSSVYFIAQEDSGFHYWVVRFSVRPNTFNPGNTSSFGPYIAGEFWTITVTAEQWQSDLVQNYDYVALFCLNDYFYEHYSGLFEDPSQIANESVYRVNKVTGLLELCE